jgi:hypothetical protein
MQKKFEKRRKRREAKSVLKKRISRDAENQGLAGLPGRNPKRGYFGF